MKIVINKCFGGFSLSLEGRSRFISLKHQNNMPFDEEDFCSFDIERNDPILVQVVEELGDKANNRLSELKVVEIPDDVEWRIEEYDGTEWVAEVHRTWA